MQIELDPELTARTIVALVDDRGPGLSEERERQLVTEITAILSKHETAKPDAKRTSV